MQSSRLQMLKSILIYDVGFRGSPPLKKLGFRDGTVKLYSLLQGTSSNFDAVPSQKPSLLIIFSDYASTHLHTQKLTFEMNNALFAPLDLNALVYSLVALQFRTAGGFITHETLLTFQYKNRPIDEVEIVFAIVIYDV